MPVRCDEFNQICVIAIDGELSGDTCGVARAAIEEKVAAHHMADFIVDLEKCAFIDSEGLETLLWAKRKCEDLFGQFRLTGADENCRKILEITRLDHRFEMHKELATALKTMR